MKSENDIQKLILSKKIEIDTLEYINYYGTYDSRIRKLRNEVDILEEIIYF
jgi:hypothetical protein